MAAATKADANPAMLISCSREVEFSPGRRVAFRRALYKPHFARGKRARWQHFPRRAACRLEVRRELAAFELQAGLRNELGIQVGLDRLGAALRPVARILHAAERHFR